jgi:hypothetical protein
MIIASCGTAKYVADDQKLLDGNKIEFKDKENITNQSALSLELNSFILQQPNNNFFWLIPREWFYFKNSSPGDTSWFSNWVRNSLGEKPVFHNEKSTQEAAKSMQQYLQNKKGYYEATVDYEEKVNRHKTKISYNITAGTRFKINSIDYIGEDPQVVNILKEISTESRVNVGDPLDAANFEIEKSRMVNELQNRGYANFLPNYLDIKGDSTGIDHGVDVFFQVYAPLPDTLHKRYTLGTINVFTDYYSNQDSTVLNSRSLDDIDFMRQSKDFIVRPSLLSSKIFLKKGDILGRDNRLKTFRKLSDLGTYRFVQLESNIDPNQDTIINYNIYLTPHEHAWVADIGFEINFSSVASQTQRQLFGLAANGVVINRNLLGGAEQNTFSVTNGYELNLDSLSLSTFNLNINNTLVTPKHIDFLGVTKVLKSIGILSDARYSNFKTETSTSFNMGYNLIDILNFYKINSFNAAISYDYQPSQNKRFIIRQTAFALNEYQLEQRFLNNFGNNQLIINSFQDNLSTGYLFNEVTFFYNSKPRRDGYSYSLLGGFEASGWETHLVNKLYNGINSSSSVWSFSEDIAFAKYVKAEIDARFYKVINSKQSLAFRFNTGIAVPFGEQEVVPFIEQFSVGGPTSMRAWDQKELGPGSYKEVNQPANQIFFQQGDIRLEMNAEYRFDILWLLEGALFTDIGNVWTLEKDELRPGANITSSFYKQLAIGAGWGMRWDFTYFNIRFDFGYRIRNPFPDEGGSHWYSWKQIRRQGFGNMQVAVNYPF